MTNSALYGGRRSTKDRRSPSNRSKVREYPGRPTQEDEAVPSLASRRRHLHAPTASCVGAFVDSWAENPRRDAWPRLTRPPPLQTSLSSSRLDRHRDHRVSRADRRQPGRAAPVAGRLGDLLGRQEHADQARRVGSRRRRARRAVRRPDRDRVRQRRGRRRCQGDQEVRQGPQSPGHQGRLHGRSRADRRRGRADRRPGVARSPARQAGRRNEGQPVQGGRAVQRARLAGARLAAALQEKSRGSCGARPRRAATPADGIAEAPAETPAETTE